MRKWMFLSGAVIAEVTGTLALKAALDSPAVYILVAVGYIAAFVFLSLTLRAGMPLGIAYGIWGATGVALTAVLSLLLFGEPLTPVMITGLAFVMAGVILVEVGNREDDAHDRVPAVTPPEWDEQSPKWDAPVLDQEQVVQDPAPSRDASDEATSETAEEDES